jgi:hypothetical protein
VGVVGVVVVVVANVGRNSPRATTSTLILVAELPLNKWLPRLSAGVNMMAVSIYSADVWMCGAVFLSHSTHAFVALCISSCAEKFLTSKFADTYQNFALNEPRMLATIKVPSYHYWQFRDDNLHCDWCSQDAKSPSEYNLEWSDRFSGPVCRNINMVSYVKICWQRPDVLNCRTNSFNVHF